MWVIAFVAGVVAGIFLYQAIQLFFKKKRPGFKKSELSKEERSGSAQKTNNEEYLLELIFENAPVCMLLMNLKTELIKTNRAARDIGLNSINELAGAKPGDAFGCINASFSDHGCGNGAECSKCRLRNTINDTFKTRQSRSKVPVIFTFEKNNNHGSYNFHISTSYIEIQCSPMVLMVMEDVTSMIKAERAVIDSEFRYKQITRAITDYIYTLLVHENGDIFTLHTPACFKITGYQTEEFEKDQNLWFRIVFKDDLPEVIEFIRKAKDHTEKNLIEHRIVRKDGSICWVSNSLVTKAYRKNKVIQYDGIIRDITERKQAEEALENQNKLFNTMLDNLPIGIFMMSAQEGKPILANKHAIQLMGKGIVENADTNNLNEIYSSFLAGTNVPYPIDEMPVLKGLKGIESRVDNMEVLHPDGNRVLLEVVGCPVYDKNNNIVASLVGFYDITERKNAEIALRESERKLSIIFEYSHIGISLSDDKGNIQYMNPAFCKLLGYESGKAVGENFRMFTDLCDIESEIGIFDKLLKKETELLSFEKRYINSNGQEIWAQLHISCFRNLNGMVTNFIAIIEDISERKKSIDLLKTSEEKFRNIFNTSNDSILITDLEGKILEVNNITIEHSGFPIEALKSLNILDLVDVNDKELIKFQLANIQNRKGFIQTSYINGRGEKLYIEIVGHTIHYNGNEAILMISRDISERKIMQQKILNAIIEAEEKERTYFSQELHDGIGPILSTIKLYLQWIQSPDTKSDKGALLDDALNTIEDAIASVKEISNKLSPNVLKKFGLETAIQSFVRKLENLGKVKFSIDVQLFGRMPQEVETMLYRVFVEAINNSLKYADATHIQIMIFADNNSLNATFRDNGKGFEISSLENVAGNGLFNMHNRVQICEGTFLIKSKPGQGTEISITLPAKKYSQAQLN